MNTGLFVRVFAAKLSLPSHRPPVAYILYDADCGPCSTFEAIVMRLDVHHNLAAVPLQDRVAHQILKDRMPESEVMKAFHIVQKAPREEVFSGGDALVQLLRFLPLGLFTHWMVIRFAPLEGLVRGLYATAANHRGNACAAR